MNRGKRESVSVHSLNSRRRNKSHVIGYLSGLVSERVAVGALVGEVK